MPRLDPSANRVVLRPRWFDRLYVFLLLLPGPAMVVIAALALTHTPQPETVHCERATGTCTYTFPSMIGADTYSDALANWKTSAIVPGEHGGTTWKVTRGTKPLWLVTSEQRPAVVATIRTDAAELQAFLGDPARPSYDASFDVAKPMSPGGPIAMLLFACFVSFFGLRWWRGWKAELVIDPEARTLTIHRRPMFFTGPRTITYARSDLQLLEHVEKRYLGRGQSAKFARFELHDTHGKRVFKYMTLFDDKRRAQLEGDMALLAKFFST